jgi:hypothetical protein
MERDGSLEKSISREPKKNWFLSVRNDITCFSNGCCNVVGHLVETAVQPLSFAWKVLGGRVSPRCKGHPK